ncbi:MAG: ABC transporter permease, partial [Proteobacteria bacterium]|nr:ABC transporter permease [Pseudomonadota bacterium]
MIQVRLEQRAKTPAWFNLALPLAAVLATLVLCGGLVMLAGANVFEAYGALF